MTRLLIVTLVLAGATVLAAPLAGQPAFLVRDIDPSMEIAGSSSRPRQLYPALGKLFFAADLQDVGQVWSSDGTANGTRLLAGACPGRNCGFQTVFLGTAGGVLFWTADSDDGRKLWRSDGTRAGTFALAGPVGGSQLVAVGGLAYFTACGSAFSRCGLWRSDGTAEGTRLVMADPSGYLNMNSLTVVGDKLFFVAGEGLWVRDDTPAGASLLVQLSSSGIPSLLTAAAGRLFFVAADDSHGQELWTSDGTAAGTRPITAFEPPAPFDRTQWLKPIGSRVYFLADDVVHGVELWRSDGTAAGTVRLTDFGFASPFSSDMAASQVEALGGAVLFVATDGLSGWKLWRNDGTTASTTPVAISSPGSNFVMDSGLVRVGNRLLFTAKDAPHGAEPWSTDGTPRGTAILRDICPGTCSSLDSAPSFLAVPGAVLFPAAALGPAELWRSDGTAAGTRRFADLGAGASLGNVPPARVGGEVFFTASNDRGEELWKADLATGHAQMVLDIWPSPASGNPRELLALQDRIVFTACVDRYQSLWQSTGSPAGTVQLATPGTARWCDDRGAPQELTPSGGAILFFQNDDSGDLALWKADLAGAGGEKLTSLPSDRLLGYADPSAGERHLAPRGGLSYFLVWKDGIYEIEGSEIWQTDGTAAGTHLAVDLSPDVRVARHLAAAGGKLYFIASDVAAPGSNESYRIWTSDGTATGTVPLTAPDDLPADEPPRFMTVGSRVLLFAHRDQSFELWKTDGTDDGTSRLRVLLQNAGRIAATEAIVHNGSLYFTVDSYSARQLWRSDGTEAGTALVATLEEGSAGLAMPASLTVLGDRLFFSAADSEHGRELWQSDGTAAGTTLVRDILPGAEGSEPSWLHAAGGRLFFAARDGVHGRELWQSDGSAAGTRMVQDVAPEAESSSPAWLTDFGGSLYFSADDGWAGRELWALPLAAPATCEPSPTSLCLGGRFRVEASWRLSPQTAGSGTAVPLTGDTGYFWFFSPQNVEVVIKVLDGRTSNDHFWVFYGALSDVEYALTVTDTQTGLTRRYSNLPGQLASVGDTHGFGPLGAFSTSSPAVLVAAASPPPLVQESVARSVAACEPGPARLCLDGSRFAVEVSWRDFAGNTGTGKAVGISGDTGSFWFFGPENVEVMVKVLDGTAVNGKHWVFFGALSNVEYQLTVTDTATGKVRTYVNPSGRLASVADTAAF